MAASNFDQAVDAFKRGDLDRARTAAEAALQSSPSPQWQHLLGLVQCRGGHPSAGLEHLRAASQAEPENVAYRVMLARALLDCGRAGEALETAAVPLGTSPAELALWHVRAEAAGVLGELAVSLEALGRLCAAGISDWRVWSSYGSALGASGRWLHASHAFRRATELNPKDAALRRSLATALARAGRYDESADELRLWVDAVDDDAETRILLARLLADIGRTEESTDQLRKAVQLATGRSNFDESGEDLIAIATAFGNEGVRQSAGKVNLRLLRETAQLLERTGRVDALEKLIQDAEALGVDRLEIGYAAAAAALRGGDAKEARRLLSSQPAATDPVRWHWLMGRIADALGDPPRAFLEAEAMNRAASDYDFWRGRAEQTIAAVDSLTEAITPEWVSGLRPLPQLKARRLAFLVGFPRSGTTLLDTFLMGHAQIAVLEEVPLVDTIEQTLGRIVELPERSKAQLAQARAAYDAELAEHVDQGFSGLVIDKLPLNMLAAPFLHCLFPGAPIIFAQRHPCDCVLSCFMQAFALNHSMACFLDIVTAARYYDSVMRLWTRSKEMLPLKVHTLVYEQLVIDPERALRPLIKFLGLSWDRNLLDHRATAKARSSVVTPSYNQVTEPLSRAASGRWKRFEKQLEPVLPLLLPWAQRLGYED